MSLLHDVAVFVYKIPTSAAALLGAGAVVAAHAASHKLVEMGRLRDLGDKPILATACVVGVVITVAHGFRAVYLVKDGKIVPDERSGADAGPSAAEATTDASTPPPHDPSDGGAGDAPGLDGMDSGNEGNPLADAARDPEPCRGADEGKHGASDGDGSDGMPDAPEATAIAGPAGSPSGHVATLPTRKWRLLKELAMWAGEIAVIGGVAYMCMLHRESLSAVGGLKRDVSRASSERRQVEGEMNLALKRLETQVELLNDQVVTLSRRVGESEAQRAAADKLRKEWQESLQSVARLPMGTSWVLVTNDTDKPVVFDAHHTLGMLGGAFSPVDTKRVEPGEMKLLRCNKNSWGVGSGLSARVDQGKWVDLTHGEETTATELLKRAAKK